MRKLVTGVIAAVGLATVMVSAASADTMQSSVRNQAEQDQLQRDSTHSWLDRAPRGVVVSPSDRSQTPQVGQASTTDQAASRYDSQHD